MDNPLSWVDPLGLMILYRGMNDDEYSQLMKNGTWKAQGTLEGKWFAESYNDAVIWGQEMGHGGDKFKVVQVNVPDEIANRMHRTSRLDAIGPARYAQLEDLNDPRVKITWSKDISYLKCK